MWRSTLYFLLEYMPHAEQAHLGLLLTVNHRVNGIAQRFNANLTTPFNM
jgi:hypothetical protein